MLSARAAATKGPRRSSWMSDRLTSCETSCQTTTREVRGGTPEPLTLQRHEQQGQMDNHLASPFDTVRGDRADNAPSVHSPHLTTPPSRGRNTPCVGAKHAVSTNFSIERSMAQGSTRLPPRAPSDLERLPWQ